MAEMTYEQFLVELDKMNPLEKKEYWCKIYDDRVCFQEDGIFWDFFKNGDVKITDGFTDAQIKLGNYDFEDILKKIEVWFK